MASLMITLSWCAPVWTCMSRCMMSVGLSGRWPCRTFRMLCSGMKRTPLTSLQHWMILLSSCGSKKVYCYYSSVANSPRVGLGQTLPLTYSLPHLLLSFTFHFFPFLLALSIFLLYLRFPSMKIGSLHFWARGLRR